MRPLDDSLYAGAMFGKEGHVGKLFVGLVCSTAIGGALIGCSKKRTPTESQAPVASASVAPVGSEAPAASAMAAAPSKSTEPKLDLVARSPAAIAIIQSGSELIVESSGVLYRVDAAGLHHDLGLLEGLRPLGRWESLALYGEWPKRATIAAFPTPDGDPNACRITSIFKTTGDRWSPGPNLQSCEDVRAFAQWKEQRTLAITTINYSKDWRFLLIAGKVPVALPVPTPAPIRADAGGDDSWVCRSLVLPDSAAGTPEGHLFVAGRPCDDSNSPRKNINPIVERWTPESRKATVDTLPEAGFTDGRYQIVVRSERDAYLAARETKHAYMAHFDGATWQKLELPADSGIADLIFDASGVLWMAQGKQLHRRQTDGSWQSYGLPEIDGQGLEPVGLATMGETLWVTARAGKEHFLLGPTKPTEPPVLPGRSSIQATEGYDYGPLPATAACNTLLVTLRYRVAPGQHFEDLGAKFRDQPDLAGVQFVIDQSPTGDQLAAVVPTMAIGRRVVELAASAKAKPKFVCRAPKIKSTVTL